MSITTCPERFHPGLCARTVPKLVKGAIRMLA